MSLLERSPASPSGRVLGTRVKSALWKVCEATCFMKARHQVKTDDRKGENP